ncbi:MAG TPA: Holliday junction branch migration protein RuvA [Thiothrix sp.]|nr:Holliday junction branch migration protein RuvA [Thiothrix sp.]
MIGFLRGVLIIKQAPDLMLDVQGVGYELQASMSTFCQLPELQQETCLYTHLSIRDDAHSLFGFATVAERDVFRVLLKVNGVGPKMALAILSTFSVSDFSHYVQQDDVSALTKIPGVGKKTAERLILDMRDRLPMNQESAVPLLAEQAQPENRQRSPEQIAKARENEAVNALLALGYKPVQASKMIHQVLANHTEQAPLSVEAIIRQALKTSLH